MLINADISKVKETIKKVRIRQQDHKIRNKDTACRDGKEKLVQVTPCVTPKEYC